MPTNRTAWLHPCLASVLGALVWSTSALGLVTRHDRPDSEYRALGEGHPQAVELSESGGSGAATLIAPRWLMTAAHVAEHKEVGASVRIGDQEYRIQSIVPHPDYSLRPMQHDIALIELDRDVTGVEPAALYDGSDELGQDVLFVGSGNYGTGRTGPQTRDKVRRAATNRVSDVDPLWLSFRFDPPGEALYHEGISGPGDSGGAAFVRTDSTLWVIGVSSWQDTKPTERNQGLYGVIEKYTRVSTHLPWIYSVIDSP